MTDEALFGSPDPDCDMLADMQARQWDAFRQAEEARRDRDRGRKEARASMLVPFATDDELDRFIADVDRRLAAFPGLREVSR